jgi:hypothetical protein
VNKQILDLLARASKIGEELENLVVQRGSFLVQSDRTLLIVGYWALVFDYDKSILALLEKEFYGGAFALLRPMLEAVLRAHIALAAKPRVLKSLRNDKYTVNFKEIGLYLDKTYGFGGLFQKIMTTQGPLHSFTHSGTSQLSRRFDGNDVRPTFSEAEIIEVIGSTTSMIFMVTALATKHLGFEQEWKAAHEIYKDNISGKLRK